MIIDKCKWIAALVLGLGFVFPVWADAPTKVRIGYAISKTGPFAGGANAAMIPNYQMWVRDVNAAGGIKLKDRRVLIEVVEYDDRSSSEEAVRAVERLATQDKVDFILSPWGTGLNLATGPVLNKYGYPHLAVHAITEKIPELTKRWPRSFWFVGMGSQYGSALVDCLVQLRAEGKIGSKVAMIGVAEGFGVELSSGTRPALKKAGFELVYDKSYPANTQDMTPILSEIKSLAPDVFVAFSYPPDTFMINEQSRLTGFNPKIFYTGIGTAFNRYGAMGANANGVMSLGGVTGDAEFKAYAERYAKFTGKPADRFGSDMTYASLQVLQQAIERVGTVDRNAVAKEIATGSFDTVAGKITLKDNRMPDLWLVGQWQDGEFYGVMPATRVGARKLLFPKPTWQAIP